MPALDDYALKWERILLNVGADLTTHDCPLCQMYYIHGDCTGCPVRLDTGMDGCADSPYEDYSYYVDHSRWHKNDPTRQLLAFRQLRYLIRLYRRQTHNVHNTA